MTPVTKQCLLCHLKSWRETLKSHVEYFTSFVVLRDLLDFSKQQQHIHIVLKKNSNVFISNACLEDFFPKSLNHQIVWLRRKYFDLLFMKSLKFIISSLCENSNLFEMTSRQQTLKVHT